MAFEQLRDIDSIGYVLGNLAFFIIPIAIYIGLYCYFESKMRRKLSGNDDPNFIPSAEDDGPRSLLYFGMILAIVITLIAAFSFGYIKGNNIEQQNRENLLHNIQQKYTVSKILNPETKKELSFTGLDTVNHKEIEVTTDDGQQFNLVLDINEETYEPTLTNPSVGDGKTKNIGINVDDIKRK